MILLSLGGCGSFWLSQQEICPQRYELNGLEFYKSLGLKTSFIEGHNLVKVE